MPTELLHERIAAPAFDSNLGWLSWRRRLLTAQKSKAVFVDKGCRGVSVEDVTIWRGGLKRGVTLSIKKAIHRRSAIELAIGQMKNEGRLRRNWLNGSLGDAFNSVLCGTGVSVVRRPS